MASKELNYNNLLFPDYVVEYLDPEFDIDQSDTLAEHNGDDDGDTEMVEQLPAKNEADANDHWADDDLDSDDVDTIKNDSEQDDDENDALAEQNSDGDGDTEMAEQLPAENEADANDKENSSIQENESGDASKGNAATGSASTSWHQLTTTLPVAHDNDEDANDDSTEEERKFTFCSKIFVSAKLNFTFLYHSFTGIFASEEWQDRKW